MIVLGKKLGLIYKLRGEDVASAIKELEEIKATDVQSLSYYKEKKITALIDFIEKNCNYYQDVINEPGAETLTPFERLDRLPVADKLLIKNNFSSFVCNHVQASQRSTSGTTGTPFIFKKDRNASTYMDAMMFCAYHWYGLAPLSPQARLWGSPVDLKGKLAQITKDYLLGRRRLSAFAMDDNNCKRFFLQLRIHKPQYFYCYPNAMYQFALSLERQGLNGMDIGASVAICTGEVLFPYHKEKIEQVTGCKVVNEYGSTENGIIAFECEYGKMHVMPTVHVDIINPDDDGFGEISVTELNSRSIPFVKYKNGDVGRILSAGCKCKRPFEKIEIREGRVQDFIICPSGKKVYAAILAYVLKEYAFQFKVFQDRKELININIIPKDDYDFTIEQKIRRSLHKHLGNELQIDFKVVDNIPSEKTGKLRYFVSNIKK